MSEDQKAPSPNFELSRPIIFFDAETTGVDIVHDRIVELSVIKYSPNGEKETKTHRFNPTIPIPAEATAVHGITDEDVKDKPKFAAMAVNISKYFKGCDVAGYNITRFDVPLLVEELLRANAEVPFSSDTKMIDSMTIFHQNEKRDLTAAYKFYCAKELEGAHGAEADTIATVEVLNGQIEKYDLPKSTQDIDDLYSSGNEIVDYARKFARNEQGDIVLTFGKNAGKKAKDDIPYLQWMLKSDFSNHTKHKIRQIIDGEI